MNRYPKLSIQSKKQTVLYSVLIKRIKEGCNLLKLNKFKYAKYGVANEYKLSNFTAYYSWTPFYRNINRGFSLCRFRLIGRHQSNCYTRWRRSDVYKRLLICKNQDTLTKVIITPVGDGYNPRNLELLSVLR